MHIKKLPKKQRFAELQTIRIHQLFFNIKKANISSFRGGHILVSFIEYMQDDIIDL